MSRQSRIRVLTVWPGLAQVWSGQEILGLFPGMSFALAVNLAVVARWIRCESFAPGCSGFFVTLATVTWLAGLSSTVWWVGWCHPDRHRHDSERLFREAQEAYQGRWRDSQRRIERILAMDETDADALMQPGTLDLRTQQSALARRTFRQCLESKGGAKWRWEVQQALARLREG